MVSHSVLFPPTVHQHQYSQHRQLLPKKGGDVLYYLNLFNGKGELGKPVCGDELWRAPEPGAERVPQNEWQPAVNLPVLDDHCTRGHFKPGW